MYLTVPWQERLLMVLPHAAGQMLKPKATTVVASELAVVRALIGVPEADRVATTLYPVIEGYLSEALEQQRA